jgi:hypothetical protein
VYETARAGARTDRICSAYDAARYESRFLAASRVWKNRAESTRATLLDTGGFYGVGDHALLIARALRDRRDQALLFLKFGGG